MRLCNATHTNKHSRLNAFRDVDRVSYGQHKNIHRCYRVEMCFQRQLHLQASAKREQECKIERSFVAIARMLPTTTMDRLRGKNKLSLKFENLETGWNGNLEHTVCCK